MLTAREAWIPISLVVGMQIACRLKMLPTLLSLLPFLLVTFLLLLGRSADLFVSDIATPCLCTR